MVECLVVFEVTRLGEHGAANTVYEFSSFPPPVGEIRDAEEEVKSTCGYECAILTNIIPLAKEDGPDGRWMPVTESEITGFNPEFAGRDPIGGYVCSECKSNAVLDCNDQFVLSCYCPNCGAKMGLEDVK